MRHIGGCPMRHGVNRRMTGEVASDDWPGLDRSLLEVPNQRVAIDRRFGADAER